MLYGVIYKITNTINGKIYIGQTINKNPIERIQVHFRKLKSVDLVYKSSLKYGRENFKYEIICSARNLDDLNYLESYFIQFYNSLSPNGFNIKTGGNGGGRASEELRKKISESQKRRFETHGPAVKKGTKFTEEHCRNLSKVRKGFTSENRKKARQVSVQRKKEKGDYCKVKATNLTTNEEFIFNSIADCAKTLKLEGSCISRCCRGVSNRTQHRGFKFQYLNKPDQSVSKSENQNKFISRYGVKWGVVIKKVYYGIFPSLEEARTFRDKKLHELACQEKEIGL